MLEQARLHRDVGRHFGLAFGDRAHAVPDLEADVPQHAEETLDELGARAVERVGQQHQHVDVRMREELAAAVAADGDERCFGRGAELGPDAGDHAVDEARVLAQQAARVGTRVERRLQRRAAGLELGAPALSRVAREVRGHRRGEPVHRGAPLQEASGGGGGAPGDIVSTS